MDDENPGVAQAKVAAVEAFVLRARRVREHSLARDPDALAALITPSWQLTFSDDGGPAEFRRSLPEEEAVESLSARVRPLILQDDPVHYGKLLNALGYLLRNDPPDDEARLFVGHLRKQWNRIDSRSEEIGAYRMEVGPADGSAPPVIASDNTLAFAWFYGDVVHADPDRRRVAADFGIADRFEAAVHVVARVAWLSHVTLDFIEELIAESRIAVTEAVLSEQVTVDATEVVQQGDVYIAKSDTPPPTGRDLGPEWVRLNLDSPPKDSPGEPS